MEIQDLVELVGGGGVLVLTGAGISTDSGIPDYRGDPGVVRRAPITYQEFVANAHARRRYWARSHAGWRRITDARPNPGHRAVADLEAAGLTSGVVTQNVDSLHQAAGSNRVLELHGALARTVCLGCSELRSRLELHHRLEAANPRYRHQPLEFTPDGDAELPEEVAGEFRVVDCLGCGGVLKPDVVFFGENVPRPRVVTAFEWLDQARALVVLGSSLAVLSGYRFVLAARKAGTPVAILNRGPTRGDDDADVRIHGDLSPILTHLVGELSPVASR